MNFYYIDVNFIDEFKIYFNKLENAKNRWFIFNYFTDTNRNQRQP